MNKYIIDNKVVKFFGNKYIKFKLLELFKLINFIIDEISLKFNIQLSELIIKVIKINVINIKNNFINKFFKNIHLIDVFILLINLMKYKKIIIIPPTIIKNIKKENQWLLK